MKYLLPALLTKMSTFEVILLTSSANFRTDDKLARSNSIIELKTCFHKFYKYESTNFPTNIFQLKKKTNFLLIKKCIIFSVLSIWENQNKCFTIIDRKNSWKHVVSLTFEICATAFFQFLKTVQNSFGSKNTISHVYLKVKATLKHIDNRNVTWPNQELKFLKQQENI